MQWKSTGPKTTFELSKLIFSCYYVTRDSCSLYPFLLYQKEQLGNSAKYLIFDSHDGDLEQVYDDDRNYFLDEISL